MATLAEPRRESGASTFPVVRSWRGATLERDAGAYLDLLQRTGLRDYAATPGCRGSIVLRRSRDGLAEFIVLSVWESRDAIRAFAGEAIDRARFYDEDDAYLVQRDLIVQHFDIVGWGDQFRAACP